MGCCLWPPRGHAQWRIPWDCAHGQRIEIRYMDFWKVVDGKIVDNWVNVDFAHVAAQLGVDLFNGHGWEAYDRGEKIAPSPDAKGE